MSKKNKTVLGVSTTCTDHGCARRRVYVACSSADGSTADDRKAKLVLSKDALLASFRKQFPSLVRVTTYDEVIAIVSLNTDANNWYRTYKKVESDRADLPSFLEGVADGVKDWIAAEPDRKTYRAKLVGWAATEKDAAAVMKKSVDGIRADKLKTYEEMAAVNLINLVTIAQLPIERTVRITLAPTEELRKSIAANELKAYKLELYKTAKRDPDGFKNPFA